ncbi:MAG: N-acetylneuraminate synthase family protein, partial [Gemmatimonadota bacterium]
MIGPGHPPYIIAEAGVHHENSVELAKAYIRAARVAGAHAIKFQTYKAERLATRWAPAYWDDEERRTQFEVFATRDGFDASHHAQLFDYANELGITLLSTPFDPDSASYLDELGMSAIKIASADITYAPLLRAVGELGKPVLLSTGASTLEEVRAAVDLLADYAVPVAVLHCSLAYPTPVEAANLRRIELLARTFPERVVGYSDHTQPRETELACPLAVALGARIVEKHFTLNRELPGDDHYHAVDGEGLRRLVAGCRQAWRMTGEAVELRDEERAARANARRSIVASRPIQAGTAFDGSHLDFKRPGTGLPPTRV